MVKPNSRKNLVETGPDGQFRIRISAPPVDGKANDAICRFLSEIFRIPLTYIEITSGLRAKFKTAELRMEEKEFHERLRQILG